MTNDTIKDVQTIVEAAVAEATQALGNLPTPKSAPTAVTLAADRCWALANVADARAVFVDKALRSLGGSGFAVSVDAAGVTLSRSTASTHAE